MKKMITIVLSAVLVGLCLSSCKSENSSKDYDKYTSLIADVTNDGYGTDVELDCWQGTYFQKDNMEDKTCVFNGVSYSCSYRKSINELGNSYITDFYYGENYIEFGFRSDTGELNFISLTDADYYDTEPYLPDISNPEENAVDIATEMASKYVNINDYIRIDREPLVYQKDKNGVTYEVVSYPITFVKKVIGYLSSDYIYVCVNSKGHLVAMKMGDIGALDSVTLDFDTTMLNQSITEKIESDYAERNLSVSNVQIEDQKIMLSPNGDVGMYSKVTFDFTYPNGGGFGTALQVFTTLGRKE